MSKKIIICHEYGDDSHFEALFKAENRKYDIEKSVILSKKVIFKKLKSRKFNIKLKDIVLFFKRLSDNLSLVFLKNRTIIFAVAPYDGLMLKYKKLLKMNNCIYFTSWPNWEEDSFFPKGDKSNRTEFLHILESSFKAIAFVNKQGYHSLNSIVNKPADIVNHSIITKDYKLKDNFNNTKKVNILFIGKIIERKGIFELFDTLKKIERNDFCIEFWGRGELKDKLVNYALKDNRVLYNGVKTKDFIKNNLSNFDYLILPSKKEPFGIVLIEAMAAGIPCIVRKTEGSEMLVKNNYNGFIYNNPENMQEILKEAIDLRLNKIDQYIELSSNALKTSKSFDVNFIYKKWETLLDMSVSNSENI